MSFLAEYYAYVLTVSSFSLTTVPNYSLVQDVQSVFAVTARLEKPMTGALLGCAHGLFALIPCAATELADRHSGPVSDAPGLQRNLVSGRELRSRVLSWRPAQVCTEDWVVAGKLYQLAILLLLVEGEDDFGMLSEGSESSSFVSEFVALLNSLDVETNITTTLGWPLAIAGAYAYDPEHRRVISQYVSDMEARYGFRNLTQLRALLNALWEADDRTTLQTGKIDLAMRGQGMTVMLV